LTFEFICDKLGLIIVGARIARPRIKDFTRTANGRPYINKNNSGRFYFMEMKLSLSEKYIT